MKSALVPAQITTVEDKVTGSLSLTQLLLLVAPVFLGSALFAVLPPSMEVVTYKLVILSIVGVIFGVSAIRIKGQIILLWAVTIFRYNLRPRYFVFDKNDLHLREGLKDELVGSTSAISEHQPVKSTVAPMRLTPAESIHLEALADNPQAKLYFSANRKGGLDVRISEIK
ncbi:PrgI family protein [bacterium]|nr:MAG: PrgI family protein [bacterium]